MASPIHTCVIQSQEGKREESFVLLIHEPLAFLAFLALCTAFAPTATVHSETQTSPVYVLSFLQNGKTNIGLKGFTAVISEVANKHMKWYLAFQVFWRMQTKVTRRYQDMAIRSK